MIKDKQSRLAAAIGKVKDVPVNQLSGVYSSVMNAWTTALEKLDSVIAGASYSVQDGAVLLTLSSWHLYPDLVVLKGSTEGIALNDELIAAGAQIIIGLEGSSHDDNKGVYWSLSLSLEVLWRCSHEIKICHLNLITLVIPAIRAGSSGVVDWKLEAPIERH